MHALENHPHRSRSRTKCFEGVPSEEAIRLVVYSECKAGNMLLLVAMLLV